MFSEASPQEVCLTIFSVLHFQPAPAEFIPYSQEPAEKPHCTSLLFLLVSLQVPQASLSIGLSFSVHHLSHCFHPCSTKLSSPSFIQAIQTGRPHLSCLIQASSPHEAIFLIQATVWFLCSHCAKGLHSHDPPPGRCTSTALFAKEKSEDQRASIIMSRSQS